MSEEKKQISSPMLTGEKAVQLNDAGFTPVPRDRLNIVYSIFYLLGLGTLLPWNFFITAQGYWMYKFRDMTIVNGTNVTSTQRSELQVTFNSYLSVAAMVPSTIFLILNTILSRRISQKLRLVVSLILIIVFFIVTVVMVQLDTDSWQKPFYAFTLFTVVIINCNTAIFQGAVFGLGGVFPSEITQAIMNGQALGGIFASVANIVSILGGSSPQDSAFGYFLAAVAILIVSLGAYLSLPKFEYFNFYATQQSAKGIELSPVSNRSKNVPFLHIFNKIKIHAISVTIVFLVTLSVFPAIAALVQSTDIDQGGDWNVKYFIPVGCFLIFNVGDYVGRTLAGWFHLPKSRVPLVLILSLVRIVFIPLFLFCNANPKKYTYTLFNHDAWYLLFMMLLSVSGGYLASQAMIHGPKDVEMEHQEAAGSMMAFFLGLGLMLGAALSNGFVLLI